jgi:endonuclease YncB( thermonuclease family)
MFRKRLPSVSPEARSMLMGDLRAEKAAAPATRNEDPTGRGPLWRKWRFGIASASAAPVGAMAVLLLTEPPPASKGSRTTSAAESRYQDSPGSQSSKYAEPLTRQVSEEPKPYSFPGAEVNLYDGLTFGPEGAVRTRLAGLAGPSRDAVCEDAEKSLWACGLQARAALNNLIRRAQVQCVPKGPVENGIIPAICSVDGRDVGTELVKAGFARSASGTSQPTESERQAAEDRRGLWKGGWTIRR